MSARIATESLRDLRDALDFAEHDLANGEPGAAHAVRYNRRELESMAHGIASDLLDARDELATAESRIAHALDDAATERTRADAAEAEVARLRAENTRLAHLAGQAADLVVERNHYRERAETHRSRIDWMQSVAASAMRQGLAACRRLRADLARTEAEATRLRVETDRRSDLGQLLAEVDALRAIVEGRTVPPTDEEIMAHCRGVGAWVVTSPSWVQRVRGIASVRMLADDHRESEDATWRWIALDATGRPCAWPTVPRSEGP